MAIQDDGFSTKITLATSLITLWEEVSVTPPGISGDGAVPMTTQRNTAWRTQKPKKLKTAKEISLTVRYDPGVYASVISALQVNQSIEVEFPDGSTLTVWGWLEEFTPGEQTEGEEVTADVVIMISNLNASNVETPPAWAAATP